MTFLPWKKSVEALKYIKELYNSVRFIRQGYTSREKFNALMNIPPPMTKNNYETLANKIASFIYQRYC